MAVQLYMFEICHFYDFESKVYNWKRHNYLQFVFNKCSYYKCCLNFIISALITF